jgi:hypothetical protein
MQVLYGNTLRNMQLFNFANLMISKNWMRGCVYYSIERRNYLTASQVYHGCTSYSTTRTIA